MSSAKTVNTSEDDPRIAIAPLVGLENFSPELAIEALRSFREGDADEQRATHEFLIEALDEGRPKGHNLFPTK